MVVAPTSPAPDLSKADPSPFHYGEQQVQSQTGARDISEQLGRSWHRKHVNPGSADFFARQQLLYAATRNRDERLWATVLVGPQGFASSSDPLLLTVKPLRQFKGDAAEFRVGEYIASTAIVLETRQRERLNGRVTAHCDLCLSVSVSQSFGSCPKYIQARRVEVRDEELTKIGEMGTSSKGNAELGDAQRHQIQSADTMFLATCYYGDLDAAGDGVQGADISHRGGPPGFVRVSGAGTLEFADYVGNYTFTTLGNLVLEPRAALLFVDYRTGSTLQLSGKCYILWGARELPGAQRTMRFVTEKWVQVRGALPIQAPGEVRWSPYNPLPTCQYSEGVGADRLNQLFSDYLSTSTQTKMLRCLGRKKEAEDVVTFEFEAREKKASKELTPNVFCDPGQYVTIDFHDIQKGETLNRTWTISSPQSHIRANGSFTITVKKVGVVSEWLFKNLQPGRTICCRGVDGDFTLSRFLEKPPPGFLFVAGGIGITPLRAMLHECMDLKIPTALIYSVRSLDTAVFWDELQKVAASAENAQVFLTVTGKSESNCSKGPPEIGDSQVLQGRINANLLQQVCPNINRWTVMQCGPPKMMKAVSEELSRIGFPLENLHQEAFFF